MQKDPIDLRSDTVSVPPPEMRQAMSKAQLGDDTFFDDQLTLAFQKKIAQYFGKQAALFIPSTTMGNLISVKLWTQPGQQVIIWGHSHTIDREVTGISTICGVQTNQLYGDTGVFDPQLIKSKIKKAHFLCMVPPTKLIFIENATFGGDVWPLDSLKQIKRIAEENQIKVHIDGARILNAIDYYKCDPKQIGKCFDSMTMCLSKGLCCPVGSVIIGSQEDMLRARSIRKGLGGGMKQTGLIAAAGLYALQHLVGQIHSDNVTALHLAQRLSEIDEISIDKQSVKINMVSFCFKDPKFKHEEFHRFMLANNIKIKPVNKDNGKYRFVVHRVIRNQQVATIIQFILRFLSNDHN